MLKIPGEVIASRVWGKSFSQQTEMEQEVFEY